MWDFSEKTAFCLKPHPKVQVKCYHLLGAVPGNGNHGSVKHRTNLSRDDPGAG